MKDTKVSKLRSLMKRRWVDHITARDHCGLVNCLSQRAGDFKRDGLNVINKWVKDAEGRNVCKAYRIVKG